MHLNFQYAVYFVFTACIIRTLNHKEMQILIAKCATTFFFFFGKIFRLDGENQNVILRLHFAAYSLSFTFWIF